VAIPLNSGNHIMGQGTVSADDGDGDLTDGFDDLFDIAPPAGTIARPSINQSRPTVSFTTTGVTMHNNSHARGFNISTSVANALTATGRTGLRVDDLNVSSSGTGAANWAVDFGTSSGRTVTMSSTGSAVRFATTTSTSTVTLGNISASSGQGLSVASSGTTNFTGNNVTTTTGAAVTTSTTSTGDFAFNDITSTTGTAVSVTTASGDFDFHAINSNGASKGIVVTSATGTFEVAGTGTTDGSGGTIQNATSRGAEFVSSSNITLKNMTFTNNGMGGSDVNCGDALGASTNTTFVTNATCESNLHLQSVTTVELNNVTLQDGDAHGINGVAVNGLTLTNVESLRNGNETFEDGVQLVNLTGTVNVTGGIYRDNAQRSFEVQNNSGTPTITLDGAFFGNTNFPTAGGTAPSPSNSTAGSTILIATNGSSGAAITSVVKSCTISKVFSIGAHFDMASGTNSQNVTFGQTGLGNIVQTASQGVSITGTNSGGLTASIVDNTFNNDETLMDVLHDEYQHSARWRRHDQRQLERHHRRKRRRDQRRRPLGMRDRRMLRDQRR